MTPTNSPLDQLRDIQAPADISWWPLAASWWLLLLITIVALVFGTMAVLKRKKRNAWRKYALAELQSLQARQHSISNGELAAQLNILLKRCLVSTNHAPKCMSDAGPEWLTTLNTAPCSAPLPKHLLAILSDALYKPACPAIEAAHLTSIATWIKGLRYE